MGLLCVLEADLTFLACIAIECVYPFMILFRAYICRKISVKSKVVKYLKLIFPYSIVNSLSFRSIIEVKFKFISEQNVMLGSVWNIEKAKYPTVIYYCCMCHLENYSNINPKF